MPEHGPGYTEGLLVGIRQDLARLEAWLKESDRKREESVSAVDSKVDAIQESLTHDRAKRAAWNQLMGAGFALLLGGMTFFSGALNRWFGH